MESFPAYVISTSTPSRWAVDSAARACSTWKSLSSVISDTRKLSLFMAGTPQERREQVKDTVNTAGARKRMTRSVHLGNLGSPLPRGGGRGAAHEVRIGMPPLKPRSEAGATRRTERRVSTGTRSVAVSLEFVRPLI